MPVIVEELLGAVCRPPGPVRSLLLAVALSDDLRPSQLRALADATALDRAVEAGVLVVEGEHARASHPLLAAAARQGSSERERRELHAQLAGLVADESCARSISRSRRSNRTSSWQRRSTRRPTQPARAARRRRPSSWPSTRSA